MEVIYSKPWGFTKLSRSLSWMTQMIPLLNIIHRDLLHRLLYNKLQVLSIVWYQVSVLSGPIYFSTCENAVLGQGTERALSDGLTWSWGTGLHPESVSPSRTSVSRRLHCDGVDLRQLHSCSMISCTKSKDLCKCWINVCVGSPAARECQAGGNCVNAANSGEYLAGLKSKFTVTVDVIATD